MRTTFAILMTGLVLSGCAEGTTGDLVARESAKTVVNGVVQTQFPGVNAAPITDCVIDNATSAEVLQIAQAAVVGTTPQTTALIVDIAQRPDTFSCIAQQAINGGTLIGALTQ